jgi:hypothetical protein
MLSDWTAGNGSFVAKPTGGSWLGHAWLCRYYPFFLLIILALVLRSPAYGDPDVNLDEEFYLVVADRMMHGALSYVDIWDRKPIGLFLIYAATRLLAGDGLIEYQVTASLFAGVTAGFMWLIARRSTNDLAGFLAAVAYIFWLNIFSGSAGQSPIFYNAFKAAAAWLAFRSNDKDDPVHIGRLGAGAMLLCGLTLQVQYTALPKALFLGSWFLWQLWETSKNPRRIAGAALLYGLLGLAPTLAVTLFYAAIGHLPEFTYANFWSVFDRGRLSERFLAHAKEFFLLATIPLLLCLPCVLIRRWQIWRQGEGRQDLILLIGWICAAFAGFIMIGNFYDH